MTRAMTRAALLALVAAITFGGCTKDPSTEVVVVVRSELDPAAASYARIDVSWGTTPGAQIETACVRAGPGGVPLPLTFSLVPEGAAADPFTVHAAAFTDPSCQTVVSEQRARIRFYPGRRLALELTLFPGCLDQKCGPSESCAPDGTCTPLTTLGPDQVPPFDPSALGGDGGTVDPCSNLQPGWLLCDGLDSLDGWTADTAGANLPDVDPTVRHGGAASLHFHLRKPLASPEYDHSQLWHLFPGAPAAGPGTSLHVRVWARYAPSSTTLSSMLAILSGGTPEYGIGTGGSPGAVRLDRYGSVDLPYFVTPGLPTGPSGLPSGWFCLEMAVQYTGDPANPGDAWTVIYGAERARSHGGVYLPVANKITLGLDQQTNPGDPPVDVWLDDLVVSTQPIGCN
jgi:hypothetical protein